MLIYLINLICYIVSCKLNFKLRLWLAPRLHQRTLPQKVGCINVVPRIKITNSNENQIINKENLTNSVHTSSLITPQFETLDEMLIRVNDLLSSKPINGMNIFIYKYES